MFFDDYKNEMVSLYKIKYNKMELDEEDYYKIETLFNKYLKERYKPKTIEISNTTKQNLDEESKTVDFIKTYDSCREKGYIFSLSHGVFKNGNSLFLNKWDGLKTARDISKNKMKEALKLNLKAQADMYNGHQNVKKRNANGLYGACGESNFILYNVDVISNLTGTCFYVLTSTINQIEKILGSRIILRNENEFLSYISYLMKKDLSTLKDFNDTFGILNNLKQTLNESDIDYIYNRYISYLQKDENGHNNLTLDEELSEDTKIQLKDLLTYLYNNDLNRFALFKYNCDLNTFMDDTDFIYKMMENNFENYISEKFNEHEFKEKNKDIKILLNALVYEDNFQYDVQDLCDNYKRSTVMLSDTDSTFCVSNKLFNNIMDSLKRLCKYKERELNNELEYKVHAFKMIMYIGESMSDFFLKTISGPMYQNSKDNRWKLKSEFLYNKIILFMVKKTYFGSILSQEGIKLNPMKLDNKNTEIVRSQYTKITKDFMKDLYHSLVMKEGDNKYIIDMYNLVNDYHKKFDSLTENVHSATTLGSKSNFKFITSYKNDPLSVYQYKASALYNALFPESKILHGSKTKIFPVKSYKLPSLEYLINKNEFLIKCKLNNNDCLEKINRSKLLKPEMVNIFILLDFIDKNGFEDNIKDKEEYSNYLKLAQNKKHDIVKTWYIETYGHNEELKTRFVNLFENKKENKSLISKLIDDMGISYIAIEFYKTLPECLLPLINFERIKSHAIDDRTVRIIEALRFRVYNKVPTSKTCTTNILMI